MHKRGFVNRKKLEILIRITNADTQCCRITNSAERARWSNLSKGMHKRGFVNRKKLEILFRITNTDTKCCRL